MSNYSRILNQFVQKIGCNEVDRFNEYGINQTLDRLLQINAQQNQFNREVSAELFEQTPKNVDGTVTLRDYINTILRANQILSKSINESEKQLEYTNNPQQKTQIQGNIDQFTDDLILLTQTFKLPGPSRASYRKTNSPAPVSAAAYASNRYSEVKANQSNGSGIFAEQPSSRQQSTSLKLALVLLLISFLFELILMFVRHHFLSCLAYIFVFGIYFLNYFDRTYIRLCLITLLISVGLDFIWIIAMAGPYWDNSGSHRSSFRPGFLKFVYIMTIILMVSKAIIMIILFRYRSNTDQTKKSVRIFNLRFDLDGRPVASPVYNLFGQEKGAPGGMH